MTYSRPGLVLSVALSVLGFAGLAYLAACDSTETPEESCAHDLNLSVDWTGSEWAVTDTDGGETHTEFEACRGHDVTWTLGTTPDGAPDYFAWIHIAPDAFEASAALDAATGFAVVPKGTPLALRVQDEAPTYPLYYGVLCTNPLSLQINALELATLSNDLSQRNFRGMREFQRLTFAQQDSPPRMIIR